MRRIPIIYHSLIFKLIILVGLVLLVTIFTWAYFNIKYQKQNTFERLLEEVDRLGNTIRLGTHYAMMLNSREDINEIIKNTGSQEGIANIRIFNKEGQIKFSNLPEEVDLKTNIKADACYICHREDPPLETVSLAERTRIFSDFSGYRLLGIISPIYNEPGCSSDSCHIHPEDKKVLGAFDVVVSLKETDKEILNYERGIINLATVTFIATSTIIGVFLWIFVRHPIKKLISGTRLIGQGEYEHAVSVRDSDDEIGQLALSINEMGKQIAQKQEELNRQRDEYHTLFAMVPCYITVLDRDLKLIQYNREFTRQFTSTSGLYCYEAYKGRRTPCETCPVTRTFEDGQSHDSEETGIARDGSVSHWMVRTSPIRNVNGEIISVMEMCLDITQTKRLEEEIRKSEEKHRVIFNNIPNGIFVLDRKTLDILDCNDSATALYGYSKEEMCSTSFLNLFEESERYHYAVRMMTSDSLNQVKHITKGQNTLFVNIRISPSEYLGRASFLVTTSDITKRLMAEQQLIQASKMATLGEMATGIAHELNQPLSVIKTASSFFIKKVKRREPIKEEILKTLAEEIDNHVERASRIINHLREFGRKSDVRKESIQINDAIRESLEIFSQQLKLREIEVVRDLDENLPMIMADSNRLEQVFINLLINARDAIEEKEGKPDCKDKSRQIFIKTSVREGKVTAEVKDTGIGIPKSILDKIFEPFFTTKEVGKGTGLGLSISYGIVQDYGGTIRVETRENEGCKFLIQFPV